VTGIETSPVPLLEEIDTERSGPAVVAIGGGTGLAQALRAITRYAGRITAVVSVADDGGSSGRLAPHMEIPPPGDLRRCLLALSGDDSIWRQLFEYRFADADVRGHSLGNLIIAALADLEGSFAAGMRAAERLLRAEGEVVPASTERLHLEAIIDGSLVSGQARITRARGQVESIWVTPREAPATPDAVEAIAAADQIVLGPGSLYTSVVASLLVPDVVRAIDESRARLVWVANLTTQDGETLGMDGADHLEALLQLTGVRPPSAIVANSTAIEAAAPVESLVIEPEVMETFGVDVEMGDLIDPASPWPRHDPARLGGVLGRLTNG
jgi:uncharacterized cofD-like protein